MRTNRSAACALGILTSALTAVAAASPVRAQIIRGRLLEDGSDKPIPAAQISLFQQEGGLARTVITDSNGRFFVLVPKPGDYFLRGESLGYRAAMSPPLKLIAGDTLDIEFRLAVDAVLLAPLTVTATARAWEDRYAPAALGPYYERQRRYGEAGLGRFISREQWQAFDAMPITAYLSSLPGIRLLRQGNSTTITMNGLHADCQPQFYLNGGRFILGDEPLDQMIKLADLQAIEVYRGASELPGEFAGSDSQCGVIVFWTRRAG